MDINDDMPNDGHCQPMDLISLRHKIQQTMGSMKDFFDSLLPIVGRTDCTNNQSNGQSGLVVLPNNPMTVYHLAPSPCHQKFSLKFNAYANLYPQPSLQLAFPQPSNLLETTSDPPNLIPTCTPPMTTQHQSTPNKHSSLHV